MPRIEPFQKHADRYEDWFEKNRYVYLSEIKALKKLLPGGDGLEIGVGSGRFASQLGIKNGVEPSRRMAEIAKGRGIDVVEGTAEHLPFPETRFDFVVMVTTICFVDDLQASFKEAWRVLKKGGKILIGFIDKESPLGKIYQKNKQENLFYRYATFYSIEEVIGCLKKSGFERFKFVQTVFHLLDNVKEVEEVKEGYGEGSFVVIRAEK